MIKISEKWGQAERGDKKEKKIPHSHSETDEIHITADHKISDYQ